MLLQPSTATGMSMISVRIGKIEVANNRPLTLIAGPCQLQTEQHAVDLAGKISEIAGGLGVSFIFKASFDKANRTSVVSKRGPGLATGLRILESVRTEIGCPVLTDVHEPAQCDEASDAVDVLQIPAFLCRQTDLLIAAGRTGSAINLKKGQFLAPWDVKHAIAKISSTGNRRILLCERGTSFGYNALVVDMRGLPVLANTGYPVVIDATHSVQIPGGHGATSGGQRQFAPVIARAAVAVGVAAVFMEVHEEPDSAPSDGPNMIRLADTLDLLRALVTIDQASKKLPLSRQLDP